MITKNCVHKHYKSDIRHNNLVDAVVLVIDKLQFGPQIIKLWKRFSSVVHATKKQIEYF